MVWSNKTTMEFLNLDEKEGLIWIPKDLLHKNSDDFNRIKDQLNVNCSIHDLKKKKIH